MVGVFNGEIIHLSYKWSFNNRFTQQNIVFLDYHLSGHKRILHLITVYILILFYLSPSFSFHILFVLLTLDAFTFSSFPSLLTFDYFSLPTFTTYELETSRM
jgi:hypothetical protein